MIFILVPLIFYPALTIARGEMMYPYVYVRTRMRTRIVRAREVKRNASTCNQDKMASEIAAMDLLSEGQTLP